MAPRRHGSVVEQPALSSAAAINRFDLFIRVVVYQCVNDPSGRRYKLARPGWSTELMSFSCFRSAVTPRPGLSFA